LKVIISGVSHSPVGVVQFWIIGQHEHDYEEISIHHIDHTGDSIFGKSELRAGHFVQRAIITTSGLDRRMAADAFARYELSAAASAAAVSISKSARGCVAW
jgi:hypothetical protein